MADWRNLYYPITFHKWFSVTMSFESTLAAANAWVQHIGFHFDSEEKGNSYLVTYNDGNFLGKYFIIIGN